VGRSDLADYLVLSIETVSQTLTKLDNLKDSRVLRLSALTSPRPCVDGSAEGLDRSITLIKAVPLIVARSGSIARTKMPTPRFSIRSQIREASGGRGSTIFGRLHLLHVRRRILF
jgi:regulatory Crp family protein